MKATKITYWTTSSIIAVMMTFSAFMYLTQPMMKANFQHLGFPDYFRIELAIAKLIGALMLLLPVGPKLKEWTYAGFAITFISAIISHAASGDPMQMKVMPAVFLVILAISWFTNYKMTNAVTSHGLSQR